MLRFIHIENFALIEKLETEFHSGFNVITGETGSGKSILVGAVGLLVGSRASEEMVRQGASLARVEGIFDTPPQHPVHQHLDQAGIPLDQQLTIRREISRQGANRIFVNNRLINLAFLSSLGPLLADIHGQHDQQTLLHPSSHLGFLDAFGENSQAIQQVADLFLGLSAVREQLSNFRGNEQERLRRLDLLRYQFDDIENLKLKPGLDTELQREKDLLTTARSRLQAARDSYALLYEDEYSVLSLLSQIEQQLETLAAMDSDFADEDEQLRQVRFQLEEVAFRLRDYGESIHSDPVRLEAVEERLAEIKKAKRKYGDSVQKILEFQREVHSQLEEFEAGRGSLQQLELKEQDLATRFQNCAADLSAKRKRDSLQLVEKVEKELVELAMEQTRFRVRLQSDPQSAAPTGIDQVEFLLSANPGEDARPLARIASGGEISRVMLALKSLLNVENYPKTLIFDEIDAGIGGRVATYLGQKLALLGDRQQVFCVTHLPQIAALSKHHYSVSKRAQDGRTLVGLAQLNRKERIDELSRMLAGETVTQATRRHAQELFEGKTA